MFAYTAEYLKSEAHFGSSVRCLFAVPFLGAVNCLLGWLSRVYFAKQKKKNILEGEDEREEIELQTKDV